MNQVTITIWKEPKNDVKFCQAQLERWRRMAERPTSSHSKEEAELEVSRYQGFLEAQRGKA